MNLPPDRSQMQLAVVDPQLSSIADERLRREAWQAAIGHAFVSHIDKDAPVPRDIAFRCYNLDRMLLTELRASEQVIERTQSQIAAQGIDHVILRLQLSGRSSVLAPEGEVPIRNGGFVIFDMAQRARSASKGMSAINLCLPRRLVASRAGDIGSRHGRLLLPEASALVRLMADHVRNLRACLDEADAGQRTLLTGATIDVFNAALTPATDSGHNRAAVAAVEVKQFIEESLGRPDLDVDLLRARFGLSRTPLYALFEIDGGVATYVRNRRLARAMRILSGVEGGARRRVSAVAYACGYESEKMFSRAFRRRYGVNPRDVDGAFGAQARRETADLALSWIQDL